MIQAKHRRSPDRGIVVIVLAAAGLAGCATRGAGENVFVTRSSAKSPAELHQSIRQYVAQKGWLYIGDNKLKGGEITQVRICDAKAASNIWKAGLHVSAMMPCGHMSIYQESGTTKVTMLHPRFLTMLYPHPEVKGLADSVTAPYLSMMEEVTR